MTDTLALEPLLRIIEAIKETNILVIGDIMLDRFIYGHVDRISPESPVPVLSIKREDSMLGGAGNALANLKGLGASCEIISVVGDDEPAQDIARKMNDMDIGDHGLIRDRSRPTIVKTRFLAGHQQLLRTDWEDKTPILKQSADQIKKAIETAIPKASAVILSDYGKGLLTQDIISAVIKAAKDYGIPVLVDPKHKDFSIYKGARGITPNKKELSESAGGAPLKTDQDVIDTAERIINDHDIDTVFATRSAEGMSVVSKNHEPAHFRSEDIEVFDVSGAGDSVIATIAAVMAAGGDIHQAAILANIAGSVVVSKVGTAPIRKQDLIIAVKAHGVDFNVTRGTPSPLDRTRQAPTLDWQNLTEQVRRWRARGFRIGFTNGCFDILHTGHVSYLNKARERCDRLIVGLNTDQSVKILKGPERPINDETSRATVLGALASVDAVALFGAEESSQANDAINLIETIKPDLYFKGGDYSEDQIPEAPTVKKHGGTVEIMPIYEGFSTTETIRKSKTSN